VKTVGGLRAVDGADLVVAAGRVTGLIGPNGSGKTTLFNLVDGTVRAKSGQVVLADRRIERPGRPARAQAGPARTYQLPRLFGSLTVVETSSSRNAACLLPAVATPGDCRRTCPRSPSWMSSV
jgi:ABC-type branched-subunit amino acid transport system ATPase component